jgi:site-specific recombinase XerD
MESAMKTLSCAEARGGAISFSGKEKSESPCNDLINSRTCTPSAQQVFKNALSKAGINKDTGIHSLRHSYATHLMEAGTDIAHIQKLLGHANISTTLIYAKVTNRDTKKVKSPLDSL